jgi:S-adenosylmethionine:tRNA ribosyltransferase-isomerase
MLKAEDFTYQLDDERIAKFPVEPRDSSKLLVYQNGEIGHHSFKNIVDFLPEKAFLVFNDTKVIPARLYFKRATGAVIELFLLNPVLPTSIVAEAMKASQNCSWACMIGNRKKWKVGEELVVKLPSGLELKATLPNHSENIVALAWNNDSSFAEVVQEFGQIPLPPYLNRETTAKDLESYQTVYSKNKGAVAAPTAGLHFTENTFEALEKKGIKHDFVTLHVGAGTFQPIKVENVLEHKMHNEQVLISKQFIENLLIQKDFVIPVGTTSMRSLESLYWFGFQVFKGLDNPFFLDKKTAYFYENQAISLSESLNALLDFLTKNNQDILIAETEIFIYPSYQFKICKGIITNFHQPESTLILLVAAIVGEDWRKIYDSALANDYRFLSYGDSSLLLS